jgi:osmotically-inducible protein OsmY
MMFSFSTTATGIASIAAAVFLAACDKAPETRLTWEPDSQASQAEIAELQPAAKRSHNPVSTVLNDVSITAAVTGELVRDRSLSALRIDVDTHAGQVALHGTAPSAQARDRATRLARRVQGVVSVNNQLMVDRKG